MRLADACIGPFRRLVLPVVALILFATFPSAATAQGQGTGTVDQDPDFENDLGGDDDFGLEDLLDTEIISASRTSERLADAPAAIFVVTQQDIERSGATSIPEALRMVPGLHVARITANTWAIGSRGFSGRFANKLLVLIDGRSVYTPMFAGVYWDQQDVLLEDIERIEVIRGPGGALWGANATNGVINIFQRRSGHFHHLTGHAFG